MKEAEKGIVEGLRNFVKIGHHCALKVGHLKEITRIYEVRRPKFEEGCPEVSIREELTARAEEAGSQKACINVVTLRRTGGGRP